MLVAPFAGARHLPVYTLWRKHVVVHGLPDQQEMLDVMPELDRQSCRPPLPRKPGESFAEHPKADQHDQGVAVGMGFGLHESAVPQTKNAIGWRAQPSQKINLVSLDQMLDRMCDYNKHEDLT